MAGDSPESRELASIQTAMRDDRAAYFRNPVMQARYSELITQQMPPEDRVDVGIGLLTTEESSAGMATMGDPGSELVEEWQKSGGYQVNLQSVQTAVLTMLSDFTSREQRAFMERFDRLPNKAIVEVYRALSLGKPNYLEDAPAAAVELFATTPEGSELVREWGFRAPQKVAVIKARFARATMAMGSTKGDFLAWFNGLESHEAKAVLRVVAG
ncbi:hypothetical protein [Mesorhizobium sp.]|nr:hypothetical protein [Mesorhizobium sp.]RWK57083.1 MAG: hypothetical protein EOR49_34190 [Mesorhizobium sp.]RWM45045.1 MAG: hypothetical protein EOR76_22035 [Mesorhizobium sp.]TIO64917.1 MAG: hypothetical protein E5X85_30935 [Mesorhizobium sp.]TIR42370.1 MAG: hypothetical protein E5X64_05595 [Mesorhizobium sp.]TJV85600.1 MAG: hypothetical protein E5X84_32145 [Mesorhizobium sp.]